MRVINNKTQQIISIICFILLICTITIISKNSNNNKETLTTSSTVNNQKIGWGIKRNDNHEQPDLGKKNKEILEEFNGIAIGNKEDKYIYLTFDEGYEAGYTRQNFINT